MKIQYVPTGGEKNHYSQAGLTRVSATPSKTYWRTRWDQGTEETVTTLPERGCSTGGKCFLCISKKPATNTDKAAERLPATEENECKGKNQILKSHWNGVSPVISINKDFTAIYGSGPPNGNFSTRRAPKRKNNPCDIAANTMLPTDRSEGVGSWGCENAGLLDPDSWGACERNEFSESRRLHPPRHACVPAKSHQSCPIFATPWTVACQGSSEHGVLQARILERAVMPSSPIHRRALISLLWDIWFSLTTSNLRCSDYLLPLLQTSI